MPKRPLLLTHSSKMAVASDVPDMAQMFKDLKDHLSTQVQELEEAQVTSAVQIQAQISSLQTDMTKMVDTKLEGMQKQIDSFAKKMVEMDDKFKNMQTGSAMPAAPAAGSRNSQGSAWSHRGYNPSADEQGRPVSPSKRFKSVERKGLALFPPCLGLRPLPLVTSVSSMPSW